jgi:hypothetical protein
MRLRTFLALALASACLIVAGPAAQAVAYPPTICPTIAVSTTTPLVGEAITVSGVNFTANAHVRLELHTKVYVLANVTTSAQGTFSTSVTMPAGVVGSHTIVAIGGGAVPGCPAEPIQIVKVQPPGGNGGGNGGGSNGGGTAFTGVDVLLLVLIAALLVGAGVMLNRGGKRRRPVYPNEIG